MFNISKVFSIDNFIDKNTLKIFTNQISTLFSFQVLILSSEGDIVESPINPTAFGRLLSQSKELKTLYKNNFLHFKEEIFSKECTPLYFSYVNTVGYASPIILNNTLLGVIVVGEFKEKIIDNDFSSKLIKLSKEININENLISHAFSTIPKAIDINIDSMKVCSQFISNYLVQILSNSFKSMELLRLEQEKVQYLNKIKNVKLINHPNTNCNFLFNTLNSISRMAFLENASHTEEMVYCLSDLIRYKLNEKHLFPTIATEIDALNKYLFIENIKFKDFIKYCIDIPKNIMNYRIPPNIIHTIIKYCIFFNMDFKFEKIFIHIKGELSKSNIKLKIKCNNSMISIKDFSSSLNYNSNKLAEKELITCHKRLISYFGNEYGLQILNSKNNETLIQIKLPCLEEIWCDTQERTEFNAYYYDC